MSQKLSRRCKEYLEFETETQDAWDAECMDDLSQFSTEISAQAADEAARVVINNHSSYAQAQRAGGSRVGPGVGQRLSERPALPRISMKDSAKESKLSSLLESPAMDLEELRKLCWNGIASKYRPTAWKILSGYLPTNLDRRESTLTQKRSEYWSLVERYYEERNNDQHRDTFRQIHIDIPRMSPILPIFQQRIVQEIFERVLFIWAIRHPASGYVQGINDLLTPYFVVFLSEHCADRRELFSVDFSTFAEKTLRSVEADCFWCVSNLLDSIQDNYTFAQPGVQIRIKKLEELMKRINLQLFNHLRFHRIDFLQFAFRWMNCLLMREIPLSCTIRLWDTYLSENQGFANFHLFVCAAFLNHFAERLLREDEFQSLMLMLQSLPTNSWTDDDIRLVTAEAFQLKTWFENDPINKIR